MRSPAWRCLSALEPEMHRASRFPSNTAIWGTCLAHRYPMPRCRVPLLVLGASRLWRSAFGFLCLVHTQASMRHLFLCGPAHFPRGREAAPLSRLRGVRTQSLRTHCVPKRMCPQWTQQDPRKSKKCFPMAYKGPVGPSSTESCVGFEAIGTPWVPAKTCRALASG